MRAVLSERLAVLDASVLLETALEEWFSSAHMLPFPALRGAPEQPARAICRSIYISGNGVYQDLTRKLSRFVDLPQAST